MTKRTYYESLLSNANVLAMLDVIADCEGSDYNSLFTSAKFSGYADHPRITIRDSGFVSDAAGRYQFFASTWDEYKPIIGATDFSPHNQDIAAVAALDRYRALNDVLAGNLDRALPKISHFWASLPPFRYPRQGTCSFQQVKDKFNRALSKRSSLGATNTTAPVLPGDYGTSTNTSGTLSALSIGSCMLCDVPPYTLADRIVYVGCLPSYGVSPVEGSGYPYSAPPLRVLDKEAQPKLGTAPINFTPNPGSFITPAKGVLTSGFGWRTLGGATKFHAGIDIANAVGTPVLAAADGKVVHASTYSGYGNAVDIEHPNGMMTRYGHLSSILVSLGQTVKQGQVIGLMGCTGHVTGPHLHFEVRSKAGTFYQDSALNPLKYVRI